MLTIYEQNILKKVTTSFIKQVRDALATYPIERLGYDRDGRQRLFRSPANSSGRLSNSVADEVTDNEIWVTALSYIEKIIYGDKPGWSPTVNVIEKWIGEKKDPKLYDYNPISIVNRYYREGSSIYRRHQGKNSGVFSKVNIEKELATAIEELSKYKLSEITNDIFNKLAA
jgi:hypothetical protein